MRFGTQFMLSNGRQPLPAGRRLIAGQARGGSEAQQGVGGPLVLYILELRFVYFGAAKKQPARV